jgi:malonyl CoA-acyl carrier protein transacylase
VYIPDCNANRVSHLENLLATLGASSTQAPSSLLLTMAVTRHFESQNVDYNLPTRNATAVGMSIGLFAAAATAAASSLSDLAYTGAKAVRVSFAFCAHVGRTSDLLETRGVDEGLPSWAYVVTGLSADEIQKELDLYNEETVRLSSHLPLLRIDYCYFVSSRELVQRKLTRYVIA